MKVVVALGGNALLRRGQERRPIKWLRDPGCVVICAGGGIPTPERRAIARADPDALLSEYKAEFTAGSMLPKVTAACDFAKATGKPAAIGALAGIDATLAGAAGTRVETGVTGVVFAPS